MDWIIFGQMLLSLVLGGLIGFEREKSSHPAGLRTHILVCVTSAFLMIAFDNLFFGDSVARMGAGIITGIGFLGAGAIIVYGREVFGLTTAASIWATAGLGIIIGLGLYWEAVVAAIFFFIVLRLKTKRG
ncbi:MAG: MgtC/SapB family protein [Nanoarchaeota archaeon]|nr:MgtC/SapB family protein [Nanoarchaeota archaeon]